MPKRTIAFPRRSALAMVAVLVLTALPFLLPARAVGTATQMLVASLFALAFNILWRQTRLLSFGQSAFFGIGMFATIHAMRAASTGVFTLPLPLMPAAGLCAGCALGAVVGFFATPRTGTYFAMITLAFAEVIHQLASQWQGVFGGETGLSTMRRPWAGISFASDIEVYYLVLVWSLLAIAAIYYFTRTPLGRLGFALGDNERRVSFLGYNARSAKTLIFAISAMFAGLAGGLLAVANENVDYSVLSAAASGQVVVHTFIGGAGFFVGPIVGASILTVLGSMVSDATRLWPLYQGILFILFVMYLPEGIVGLAVERLTVGNARAIRSLALPLVACLMGTLVAAAAFVFIAEYISDLIANPFALQSQAGAKTVRLWGVSWHANSLVTWALPALGWVGGILCLRFAIGRFRAADHDLELRK